MVLPWPPSVNHLYINRRGGGKVLTPEGRNWKAWAVTLVRATKGYQYDKYPKGVQIRADYVFREPNRRRRDFDNLFKILNDGIEESGIIRNDCQIRAGSFAFGEVVKGGEVEVTLSLLE